MFELFILKGVEDLIDGFLGHALVDLGEGGGVDGLGEGGMEAPEELAAVGVLGDEEGLLPMFVGGGELLVLGVVEAEGVVGVGDVAVVGMLFSLLE